MTTISHSTNTLLSHLTFQEGTTHQMHGCLQLGQPGQATALRSPHVPRREAAAWSGPLSGFCAYLLICSSVCTNIQLEVSAEAKDSLLGIKNWQTRTLKTLYFCPLSSPGSLHKRSLPHFCNFLWMCLFFPKDSEGLKDHILRAPDDIRYILIARSMFPVDE